MAIGRLVSSFFYSENENENGRRGGGEEGVAERERGEAGDGSTCCSSLLATKLHIDCSSVFVLHLHTTLRRSSVTTREKKLMRKYSCDESRVMVSRVDDP